MVRVTISLGSTEESLFTVKLVDPVVTPGANEMKLGPWV